MLLAVDTAVHATLLPLVLLLCTLFAQIGAAAARSSSGSSSSGSSSSCSGRKPNIVYILADDLGFNDVPWHNSDVKAPHLEALAREGIILEAAYVQPGCSPSRDYVLGRAQPNGLYTNFTLTASYLQKLGYRTHAVGKWHLGYCHEDYLPHKRGFDTFNGFLLGSQDHFKHIQKTKVKPKTKGYDYWSNSDVDLDAKGRYSTDLNVLHAEHYITENAQQEKPFYMYWALQTPHGPNQAPDEYLDLHREPGVPREAMKVRHTYLAMVSAMDAAIGRLVEVLKDKGVYNNTIIVFQSDNGANPKNGGNNFPLRGTKGTPYEGGVRSPTVVHSPLLQAQGVTTKGLVHAVDWLPTFYCAGGGNPDDLLPDGLDGVEQWTYLQGISRHTSDVDNSPSNREHALLDWKILRKYKKRSATLRKGDMKLVVWADQKQDGWISLDELQHEEFNKDGLTNEEIQEYKQSTEVLWSSNEEMKEFRLFNISQDPNERDDISDSHPDIVSELTTLITEHERKMIPAVRPTEDLRGWPDKFDNVWQPGWCSLTHNHPEATTASSGSDKMRGDWMLGLEAGT